MEQISIWLENNSGNEITEIMNNSKSAASKAINSEYFAQKKSNDNVTY